MIRVALKKMLRDRRISLRELARRLDKHPEVISRFAREATGGVSYELLDSICLFLRCDPGALLRFEPTEEQMGQLALFGDEPSDSRAGITGTSRSADVSGSRSSGNGPREPTARVTP